MSVRSSDCPGHAASAPGVWQEELCGEQGHRHLLTLLQGHSATTEACAGLPKNPPSTWINTPQFWQESLPRVAEDDSGIQQWELGQGNE